MKPTNRFPEEIIDETKPRENALEARDLLLERDSSIQITPMPGGNRRGGRLNRGSTFVGYMR
jgi:hypothetical protein